nr:hypothetical protein [Endozoicomonas sp.]
MDKPKKINNITLSRLLKDFMKTGMKDSSMIIHSFPHGEGGIAFRMVIENQSNAVGYFVYRYSNKKKQTKRMALGRFDPIDFPFSDATEASSQYRAMVKKGIDPLDEDRQPEAKTKRLATFEDVVRFYIYYQEQTGKRDQDNVRRELNRNVLNVKAFQSMLFKLAHDVDEDDIESIVRLMVKRGVGRSSNRVKTYLTSSYNFAKKRQAKLGHLREEGFPDVDFSKIKYNPGIDVATDPSFERSKQNNLSEKQLTQFYDSVTLDPDDQDKFFMEAATFYFVTLNILLGGHRKRQLMEVTWDKVDFDERSIEIVDYKGQTGEPREYILFLSNIAIKCLKQLREITGGKGRIYPFSESYVPKQFRLYSAWAGVTVKYDGLRSTCTTLMKKHFKDTVNNYDPDDVKRIQHHVFGDVQSKHYDKNEYWEEKTKLLTHWEKYLKPVGVWA